MKKQKYTYKNMAKLVASKLSKVELIDLAVLLDEDAGNDFCYFIQEETAKVCPEMYESDIGKKKKEKYSEFGFKVAKVEK